MLRLIASPSQIEVTASHSGKSLLHDSGRPCNPDNVNDQVLDLYSRRISFQQTGFTTLFKLFSANPAAGFWRSS
jgi:hypothetical protein